MLENEVIELRKLSTDLSAKFDKNRSVVKNCIIQAKEILKNLEIWDAEDFNFILSVSSSLIYNNIL